MTFIVEGTCVVSRRCQPQPAVINTARDNNNVARYRTFLPRLANDQIEEFTWYVNHFTHGNAIKIFLLPDVPGQHVREPVLPLRPPER